MGLGVGESLRGQAGGRGRAGVQGEGWRADSRIKEARIPGGIGVGNCSCSPGKPKRQQILNGSILCCFSCCHSPFPKSHRHWKVDGERG